MARTSPVVVDEDQDCFFVVERKTARVLAETPHAAYAEALAYALRHATAYELDSLSAAFSATTR